MIRKTAELVALGTLALVVVLGAGQRQKSRPGPTQLGEFKNGQGELYAEDAECKEHHHESLAKTEPIVATIRPFKAHVRDRVLIDLRRRLAETKWPDQLPGTTWEYGADIKKVRELAAYWQKQYNWRTQEARINHFDQFTTEIDGQQIHFIHQRSPRPDAVPLMLIHGWAGSIVVFIGLFDPLTRPKSCTIMSCHFLIPSLSGFGIY